MMIRLSFVSLVLLSSCCLCQQAHQTSNRGNFLYSRDPLPLVFHLGQSYPDRPESDQCRPIRLRITRNSRLFTTGLVTNANRDIIFHSADARLMTSRLQSKLNSLAREFTSRFQLKLTVLQAWTEYSGNDSDPNSLHFEGRSVKILVRSNYVSFLLREAVQVGFDWVSYESTSYIRLSVIPDACTGDLDLVFMLDQSGSVGPFNHRTALKFIHDVSSFYNISANATQIGMVTYSTSARVEFALDTHQSLSGLQQAILDIPYRGGFTATAWALAFAEVMLTPTDYGARPESEGIPKIAVLITDGRSNLYPVASAAADLRNAGVQVFTVGVGAIYLPELLAIATDPDIQHVFLLNSFSDAPYFVDFLSYTACETPAIVTPGENTTTEVEEDQFRYFQTFCPAFSHFIMIEEVDIIGTCSLYASASVQNPGPLSPTDEVARNENTNASRKSVSVVLSSGQYVYVSVRGLSLHNRFSVIIWDMIFMEDEYNISVIAGISETQNIFNLTSVLQPNNATFLFSIQDGNDQGYFRVGLLSGIVTSNHSLNETQGEPIVLTLVGQNSEFSCHRGRVLLRITAISTNVTLQDFSPARVNENATVGESIAQAVVNHGIPVQYVIQEGPGSNLFDIGSSSGLVTVAGMLDFETQSSYNLTVVATSTLTSSLFDSAVLMVQVLDVNESPFFTNSCVPLCQFFVEENSPNFTILGTLTFEDPDFADTPNGELMVTIDSVLPQASFSLVQSGNAVMIVANESFDRETSSSYTLTLRVTDGGTPPLSSTLLVRIVVTDVNDNAPEFILAPSTLLIREGTPVQTMVARYEAMDRDEGSNAQISYSVISVLVNVSLPFEINPVNGELTISAPLDFEQVQSYIILITARNPDGLSSETATAVIIGDDNDNPPIFNQPIYNASVSEGDPIGTFVVQVGATDADLGLQGAFDFSLLQDGNFNDSFQITPRGNVTLAKMVDREQISVFNLTAAVTDRGVPPLTTFATILVTVTDINDNAPVFARGIYQTTISEDAEPMDILTITAYDSDAPQSPNSRIVFSLDPTGNFGGVFNLSQVDNNNAVLRLVGRLDFETLDYYVLRVVATDQGWPMLSGSATVIVNVTDANEAPEVITGKGSVSIPESVPVGFRVARLNVTNDNRTVSVVSIFPSGASGVVPFGIEEVGANVYVVVDGELDFEMSRNFTLTIQSLMDGIIHLTINIIDVNELPPVFEPPGNFSVEEEKPSGTFVGRVTAMDGDTGPLSGVTYSIVQDTPAASLFSIDADTGDISTAQVLDREQLKEQNLFLPSKGSTETINIMATDIVVPFRSAVVSIWITLVDINDNDPVIQTTNIPITVAENQPAGEIVHRVVAMDRDIGSNGQISFTLEVVGSSPPFPFAIDSDGVIRTTTPLDAESVSSFTLLVRAFDNGVPRRNSSVAMYVVLVRDLNDNAPVFTQNPYEVSIPETAAIGSSVLVLQASDGDRDRPNSDVRFAIVAFDPPEAQSLFNITSDGLNSSLITVIGQLDFENRRRYSLVVEAIDNGTPSLSSRANVTINILNVDETPPRFFDSCISAIREGTAFIGMAVTQCSAVDIQDGGTNPLFGVRLTYNITAGNINDTFRIDNAGVIFLQQLVDRETIAVYQLNISATDPGGQSAYQVVTIIIVDDNDNPPVITNPNSTVFVSASDIRNNVTNFITVMATDADEGVNAELIFSVTGFAVNVNGTSTDITVIVSNRGGVFPTSTVVTLELEIPCVLQSHRINPSSGELTSLLLCDVAVVPDDVNVALGGTLELQCFATANFAPERYRFSHNNTEVSSMSRSFELQNVTFEASGSYTCTAFLELRMLQSDNGIVRVQVPPEITAFPSDVTIPINTQALARCSASGLPSPTFTWSRMVSGSQVSVPIVDVPGDQFLINGGLIIITQTSVSDTGVYTCTASNPVGEDSASFRVTVFSLSSLVQARVQSFSNRVAMASVVCHDTNQQEFMATMSLITGARVFITDQSGSNLCDSNACSPSPCRNGGVCTLQNTTSSGFECDCAPGYSGATCEQDINECLEDPCQFGGTCVNSPEGSFMCMCEAGYVGLRCQYRNVCSNATCPEGLTCIHTIINTEGFVCLNISNREVANNLRVIVRGSNSTNTSEGMSGSLDEQVNTFQESNAGNNGNETAGSGSNRRKRMADDGSQPVNTQPMNTDLVTACEARFIPDPFSGPRSGTTSLILIWACPSGISPPSTQSLDGICNELFFKQSVSSCSSPSGFSLETPSVGSLPSTSFTFTFLILDSDGTPLSGPQSLALLTQSGALDKLKDSSYQVANFSLVAPPPATTEQPILFTSAIRDSSMATAVGASLAVIAALIVIVIVVVSVALFLYFRQRRKKIPVSYNSTSENVYHSYDASKPNGNSSEHSGQRLDIFDDEIYSSGTYVPPSNSVHEQSTKLRRLSSKLRSSSMKKKRTDSTDNLLGDLAADGEVVVDEPHELLAESSMDASFRKMPPPVPPRSSQPQNINPLPESMIFEASGPYRNEHHFKLGAMGNAGQRWESYQLTKSLKNHS